MKLLLLTFSVLIAFVAATIATAQTPTACPRLEIIGPSGLTMPGEIAVFSAKLESAGLRELRFVWEVSLGTKEEGQGTSKIAVRADTDKLISSITATVKVIGLPEGCTNTTSETVGVAAIIDIFPIDEYGRMPYNDERGRLDVAIAQAKDHPEVQLLFVLHAPEQTAKANLTERKRRIVQHIVGYRKFPASRIRFVRRDSNRVSTEVYMQPPHVIDSLIGGDTILP